MAKNLGQAGSVDANTFDSGTPNAVVTENSPHVTPRSSWDDFDSPGTTNTVSGSNTESVVSQPSEKKKFFGKKKSEKVKESSKEQTQAPQVDPDDPWA
jgi:hypothetical protein